MLTNSTNQRLD